MDHKALMAWASSNIGDKTVVEYFSDAFSPDDQSLVINMDESNTAISSYYFTEKSYKLKGQKGYTGTKHVRKASFMMVIDNFGKAYPLTIIPAGSLQALLQNNIGIHWEAEEEWDDSQKYQEYYVYQRKPATMDNRIFKHCIQHYYIPLWKARHTDLALEKLPIIVTFGKSLILSIEIKCIHIKLFFEFWNYTLNFGIIP